MFLFLGLDGADYRFVKHYKIDTELPIEFNYLEQDLPGYLTSRGMSGNEIGWWTNYVWPAILSGKLLHKMSTLKHYELPELGLIDSWVWQKFNQHIIVNLPISIPEYNKNQKYFKSGTISRQYKRAELKLLGLEIKRAVKLNCAMFCCTRILDCYAHQKIGVDDGCQEWVLEDNTQERQDHLGQQMLDWYYERAYEPVKELLCNIPWDHIDQYMIVSDHGIDSVGAGSYHAHSQYSVLSTNLGTWDKMSELIPKWAQSLVIDDSSRQEDEQEIVQKHLEALGYI